MLNNIAIYSNTAETPHNRKTLELYEFLKGIAPCPVKLNPETKSLTRSLIIIAGYNKEFFNLHETNKIVFLCRKDFLSKKEELLLPVIDTIITHTVFEAMKISWQLKCGRFNNRVVNMLPWCKPQKLIEDDSIFLHSFEERFRPAFSGYKLQSTNQNAGIRVCLSESDSIWPYNILEGMASGAIPITTDRYPFSEFIINGHNGFLIRSPSDVVQALQKIEKDKMWLSFNARATINAMFEPNRYLSSLMNIEGMPNTNQLTGTLQIPHKRCWLIRERIFKDGIIQHFPTKYSQNLTVVDLNSIQEILGYFLNQEFSDAYIFGCNLDDQPDIQDMIDLSRTIIKFGARAKKLHFCRNEPIPASWEKVFSNLSVIPVVEGLKQISD